MEHKEKLQILLKQFVNIEGVIKHFMQTILQMHQTSDEQIYLNIKYNFDKIINEYKGYENYSLIKYLDAYSLTLDLFLGKI